MTPLQRKSSQYRSYREREGPRALGSKQVPDGAENCLEGLTFVITGASSRLFCHCLHQKRYCE